MNAEGAAFMGAVRDAVRLAGTMGVPRVTLAREIGVSPRVFENWMTPSHELPPRLDGILRLIAADGPLPVEARRLVLEHLDRELGRTAVEIDQADQDDSPVGEQVLQVFAAGGRVAALVESFTREGSDGGRELTAAEARLLLPHAVNQAREANELVATLHRAARVDVKA